jgi:IS30 family transposase
MAKHLTYDDRLEIERYLKLKFSFSAISRELNRHKTTISKEVTLRSTISKKGGYGRSHNACIHRYDCDLFKLCDKNSCNIRSKNKYKYCKFCSYCNDNCKYFKEVVCERLNSPPYVCNSCEKKNSCTLTKFYYNAKTAQKDYENLLIESRTGISCSPEEIKRIDDIIKPLINKGHSIHHIVVNNRDSIMLSEKTLYNYIEIGALSIKNIDLPKKNRYRPRKRIQMGYKVDKKCLEGRKYGDYLEFLDENKDIAIVQMDTVEGRKGGKVLLTIHFIDSSFMLMFLRDANDSKSVKESFKRIYDALGPKDFECLFPLLLTDNGSEFSDPNSIERIGGKDKLTNVFYCYPYSAFLKPEIENNHDLIRRVIPKGKSMDNLTQEKVNLLMSHVNSYGRKKLNDLPPYEAFSQRYGFKLINALDIKLISPNNIILKPRLLV